MRVQDHAKDLPSKWYNIAPDMGPAAPTMVSPSGYPLGPHDLRPLASWEIAKQELEREQREIEIPDDLRQHYADWRPTPLFRAEGFERHLDTPARIFYKYEGGSPSGGHEFNTALAQAYYASKEGVKRIVTATGLGEWGAAMAIACNRFGIDCKVYMARSCYEGGGFGRRMIEVLGAEVVPSPSEGTAAGRKLRDQNADRQGSLTMAISEAFTDAMGDDDAKFAWGTVMNHVLLHQSVIGLEAKRQLRRAKAKAEIVIGAAGGGCAFGGLVFPFLQGRGSKPRVIAVEPVAAPCLTKGRLAYDFVDAEGLTPMLKMYTLGRGFVPPGGQAGGIRFHGLSPLVSALYRDKRIEARTYAQHEAFQAAIDFARCEGYIPSPESAYAIKAVVDEANACRERGEGKDILFVLNASGNLELDTYAEFVNGNLEDETFPEAMVNAALDQLPDVQVQPGSA